MIVHSPVPNLPDNRSILVSVLPSGTLELNAPPFDRLVEAHVGQGLFALATVHHDLPADAALFFLRTMARQALTRMARATAKYPDDDDKVTAELIPSHDTIQTLIDTFPPITGYEYVSVQLITHWHRELRRHITSELTAQKLTPHQWLQNLGSPWDQIGRVFFHLAENKEDRDGGRPFAFLATFAHQSSSDNQIRHLPLSTALKLYSSDHDALISVLHPLREAAQKSSFLRELLDSNRIFSPLAWTTGETLNFFRDCPIFEETGIILHMVNLWKQTPPKLKVKVEVDSDTTQQRNKKNGISVNNLLRFSMAVTLGGRELTPEEVEELLKNGDGLIRFKGEWVRVDAEKISELMKYWKRATAMLSSMHIPLVQGLRFLVNGPNPLLPDLPEQEDDYIIEPGENLECLFNPSPEENRFNPELISPSLRKKLRPYQLDGVEFLYRMTSQGLGACLADDMGLGKTLQALTWLDMLRLQGDLDQTPALIVTPASLLENWKDETARFTPNIKLRLLHPSASDFRKPIRNGCHALVTTYGMLSRTQELQKIVFPAIILDEAQAIKNAASGRSTSVRSLQSPKKVALSGTPVENSLQDVWSLMEFLNPGLLGNKKGFESFTRRLQEGYAPLRRLIHPFIMRRMKTDPSLVPDLPDKTEIPAFCFLSPEQAALYQSQINLLHDLLEEPDPNKRMMLVLPLLAKLKQICNHPAQFQGTEDFTPERSGKFLLLRDLCSRISERQEKVLIFTQFRSIIPHLHELVAPIFGRPGLELHGETPIRTRQQIVRDFQKESGPPFCILSLKAAGTGLTLTQASHVIHFDRWWNPAVENQATDRAYRIGQHKNVLVHRLICRGTIEERIDSMLHQKQQMARDLLPSGPSQWMKEMSSEELKQLLCGES